MRNQLKKWFAVLMAMVLGMPGYGLSIKNITTKAEDESITVHIENEERHVQTGETVSLLDGVSVEGSGEESYRAVVGDVQEQDSGLSLYEEGMEELVIPQDAAGKTYRVLYKAQSSIDNEVWNDVEGSEKEAKLIVEGSSESEEVTASEEKQEETEKEEETAEPKTVTIQGEEERTILAENEYDFIKDSDLVVKGPKEEENSYRLKVKEVKSPENGSYQYHEGDESFTPKESDEGLVYEVTYVAETSKDERTWKEVEDVQFIQKLTVAVFRLEEVRGPLAAEAILCTGHEFIQYIHAWNQGSSTKVKNLVKADVPSDLMTASLRYKYETISDPSSPVKIYMWHDMNAYGQYVDTVYFGTEVPGVTIYTNPDASMMFGSFNGWLRAIEKIYDSANPSMPYFFNTSKTTNMTSMFFNTTLSAVGIPFDCTNGGNVSPFSLMDTSNVTNMSGMFGGCSNVDLTGIESWDVHKVTNVSSLFGVQSTGNPIPWGIGNWEFDNLQNVDNCFSINGSYRAPKYEINLTKWDLSHCDSSKLFDTYNNQQGNIGVRRFGVGPKLVDKNGKVCFPTAVELINGHTASYMYGDTGYNGTWENENTGAQYFQRESINELENRDPGVNGRLYKTGNGESWTEFADSYIANPIAMSGTYKWGKGFVVRYSGEDPGKGKNAIGARYEIYWYKNTDTTVTLINNPFTWNYHYFKKWKDRNVSPEVLRDPGDTVALTKDLEFGVVWGATSRTITYDMDGGVNSSGNPTTFIAGEGQTINEPTKAGQVFAGWTWTSASKSMPDPWYITSTNTELDDSSHNPDPVRAFPDEDVVLKAHWAPARTITIHGNGGTTFEETGWPPVKTTFTDYSFQVPDISDMTMKFYAYDGRLRLNEGYHAGYYFEARGKTFYQSGSMERPQYEWEKDNYRISGLKDGNGTEVFGDLPLKFYYDDAVPAVNSKPVPTGSNDFYIQWKLAPKYILIAALGDITDLTRYKYTTPGGSHLEVKWFTEDFHQLPLLKSIPASGGMKIHRM